MAKKLRHIDKIRKQQRKRERQRRARMNRSFEPETKLIPSVDEYFKYGLSQKGYR